MAKEMKQDPEKLLHDRETRWIGQSRKRLRTKYVCSRSKPDRRRQITVIYTKFREEFQYGIPIKPAVILDGSHA